MSENKKPLADSIRDLEKLLEQQKQGGMKKIRAVQMTQRTIKELKLLLAKGKK